MTSGTISLAALYSFARRNGPQALDGRCSLGKDYFRNATGLVEQVDAAQGFYLWGRYDRNGRWHNIYLGKAGFGKTAHLRSRILEELKDERCCLWMEAMAKDAVLAVGAKCYPTTLQQHTREVISYFRQEVHSNRSGGYRPQIRAASAAC